MLYALLRSIAGIALRWFYRRIDVVGLERLPRNVPLLLVCNHPNALVDAMLVAWAVPRRVVLTAKATLFSHPALATLLNWVGVVPLVRKSDIEKGTVQGSRDPQRNARAFGALRAVLRRGGAVVIFPEGISHDHPSLAPLKTGAARVALEARDEARVEHLHIVPVGLTFERKDAPRTRVLVQIGEAIALDQWRADGETAVGRLTEEIDSRLRRVTLNYETADDASRARTLSTLFAALWRGEPEPVGHARSLRVDVSLAERVEEARLALSRCGDDSLRARADAFVRSAVELEEQLRRHGVALEDVSVSSEGRHALPFVLREAWIIALGGPIALWGMINHWIPFNAARVIARRSIESAADPAMRTIVAGAALVLGFYTAQGAVIAAFVGWVAALIYIASLPLAADVNFVLRDRLRRALQRARTYLLFRRRPKLHARLQSELERVRTEAMEIEARLEDAIASVSSA
ncbi:MAG TPA: lysophospholipid acyltransferase family protein [Gemmatimonadaceae bacterium]|nr:lysophospholipid acyltransferase family protein [Gemmatimonadaceae bacterium]